MSATLDFGTDTITSLKIDGTEQITSALAFATTDQNLGIYITNPSSMANPLYFKNIKASGPAVATGYDAWSGGSPRLDDDNADGVVNLVAYAVGATDPNTFTVPLPTIAENSGSLIYSVNDTQQTDITYEVEVSTDLQNWYRTAVQSAGGTWEVDSIDDATPVYPNILDISINTSGNGVTITHANAPAKTILRLKVTK